MVYILGLWKKTDVAALVSHSSLLKKSKENMKNSSSIVQWVVESINNTTWTPCAYYIRCAMIWDPLILNLNTI